MAAIVIVVGAMRIVGAMKIERTGATTTDVMIGGIQFGYHLTLSMLCASLSYSFCLLRYDDRRYDDRRYDDRRY